MNNLDDYLVFALAFFALWLSAWIGEEEEANAIGTEYVRADLLPAADAARVRALLRNYLDQRVLVQFPINGCSCWQNDFLGSMPPRSPSRALERSLLFWLAV